MKYKIKHSLSINWITKTKIPQLILVIFIIFFCNSKLFSYNLSDSSRVFSMPDDTAKCNLLNFLSEEFRDINTNKGLDYGNQSLVIAMNLNYKYGIAMANKSIGLNYWRIGVYDVALEHFLTSLPILQELKNYYQLCKINNNIGLVYFARTLPEKAREYFNEALKLADKLNNYTEKARINHNLALLEYEHGSNEKAIELHLKSNEFAKIAGDLRLIAYNECFLGKCYTKSKEFKKAKENIESSINHFEQMNNKNNLAMAFNQYSNYFIAVSDFQNALLYSNKAITLGTEVGNNYIVMEANGLISKAYSGLKNFELALKYYKQFVELSDTMKNERNIEAVAHLSAKFQFEDKIRDIEKENYKNSILIKAVAFIALLFLIISILIFIFYRWKSKTNKLLIIQNNKISDLNIRLEETNKTKDKFFSIIAHDIKNPLSANLQLTSLIADELDEFTKEELKEFTINLKESSVNLYKLLENLLQWSRMQRGITVFSPEMCSISSIVENNIDIVKESLRQKNISIVDLIDKDKQLNVDIHMINLVFRNLITNAIKFTHPNGTIYVGIFEENNEVYTIEYARTHTCLFVRDNGVGMSEDIVAKLFKIDEGISSLGTNQEKGTGLGLILCKEFIEKHNGKIWVESELGKGSTFFFTIQNS